MRRLTASAAAPRNGAPIEPRLARVCERRTVARRRPTARFVLVEDLDQLYRTGESRRILIVRWSC